MKKTIYILTALLLIANLTFAQSNIKLSAGFDYTVPMGDLGDLYQPGFGGNLGFSYKISESWEIGAKFGYVKWNADNDYYSKKLSNLSGETVNIEVEIPYSIIPIMLDGYYYLARGNFQPYLTLSIGAHIAKIDAKAIKYNGQEYNIGESESKTVLGYKLGAGFNYLFSEKIGLNFVATLDGNGLEFAQSESTSDEGTTITNSSNSTTSFINIGLGLIYTL